MKDVVDDKNKKSQYDNSMRNLIIGIIAITMDMILFIYILFNNKAIEKIQKIGNSNMIIYVIVVGFFTLLFILGILFLKNFINIRIFENEIVKKLVLFTIVLGNIVVLLISFVKEVNIYGTDSQNYVWHKMSIFVVIPIMIIVTVVFLRNIGNMDRIIYDKTVYLLYFVIAYITVYSLYMPNYFNSDIYHGHAYCNSIYNIMNNVTYNDIFTSIYGHYAIIFRLPLEIIGSNMKSVVLLISIIGGISIILSCLTVHNLIKNNSIRIITCLALALPVVGLRLTNYWQVQPHRIIFPSIFIYLASVFIKSKMTKKKIMIGYLVSVIAIVWNTETGLVCTIAWAGLMVFDSICENKTKIVCIVKTIFLQGVATIGSFMCAYGLVNLYNILLGGELNSLKTFLFPLFTLTNAITYDLPTILSAYMFELVLYATILGWVLYKYVFSKVKYTEKQRYDARLSVVITIIGMGQMTYFMNRAVYYNLDISHTSMILLLLIIIKRGFISFENINASTIKKLHCYEIIKGSMSGVVLGIIVVLSIGTIVGGAVRTNTRIDSGYKRYDKISEFTNTIEESVPKDTYAFGLGIPELYSILQWDTQCYVIDFADMNEWTKEYIINQVSSKHSIFTTKDVYEDFNLSDFTIENTFKYNGSVFVYCVK